MTRNIVEIRPEAGSDDEIQVEQIDQTTAQGVSRTAQVAYRGWEVHIGHHGAVTVPMQPTEGKSVADLATCLRAAYRRVDVGGPTSGPTTGAGRTPRGGELGTVVGEVLTTAAGALAGNASAVAHCYIYDALRTAWEQTGRAAPYAAVLAAVRAQLPPHTTLTDFAAKVDGESMLAVLRSAAEVALAAPLSIPVSNTVTRSA